MKDDVHLQVHDYKGRAARLLANRMTMVAGSRYATRKSIAKVLANRSTRVRGGSDFTSPGVMRWYSIAGKNYIRFGCHVFRNENFRRIEEWAHSARSY